MRNKNRSIVHIEDPETYRTFSCPREHCDKVFFTNGSLIKHIKLHQINSTVECAHCSETFDTSLALQVHTKKKHVKYLNPNGTVPCDICGTGKELRKNCIRYHCTYDHCDKWYVGKGRLLNHVETHDDSDKKRKLDESQLVSNSERARSIPKHNSFAAFLHSKERESSIAWTSVGIPCEYCSVVAKDRDGLTKHYENVHQIYCPLIEESFGSVNKFKEWKVEFEKVTMANFVYKKNFQIQGEEFRHIVYECSPDVHPIHEKRTVKPCLSHLHIHRYPNGKVKIFAQSRHTHHSYEYLHCTNAELETLVESTLSSKEPMPAYKKAPRPVVCADPFDDTMMEDKVEPHVEDAISTMEDAVSTMEDHSNLRRSARAPRRKRMPNALYGETYVEPMQDDTLMRDIKAIERFIATGLAKPNPPRSHKRRKKVKKKHTNVLARQPSTVSSKYKASSNFTVPKKAKEPEYRPLILMPINESNASSLGCKVSAVAEYSTACERLHNTVSTRAPWYKCIQNKVLFPNLERDWDNFKSFNF